MDLAQQLDLLDQTNWQKFEAWKETPGGRHLLRHAYRITAGLLRRMAPKQRLSVKLVWELLRHRYRWICAGLKRRGLKPQQVDGFALNNIFTAYVARHMISRRPDWDGRFELRTTGKVRARKKKVITVVETTYAHAA